MTQVSAPLPPVSPPAPRACSSAAVRQVSPSCPRYEPSPLTPDRHSLTRQGGGSATASPSTSFTCRPAGAWDGAAIVGSDVGLTPAALCAGLVVGARELHAVTT